MPSLTELQLNRQLYKTQPQTAETLGASDVASNLSTPPSTAIASGNSVTDVNTNAETINGAAITPGTIPQGSFDIADLGWIQTCVFSVTDADTVAWTSGVFTSAKGVTYSISAGNTGNMSAQTYIYLNINSSTTTYITTTVQANIIGAGRVLIAVAQNGTASASYALTQTIQVVANNIVTNTLSAISANLGSITAGEININNKAFIDTAGQATFIGVASLNLKAYTSFESSARFILTGATVTPTFGNNGMVVAPSAAATNWSRALWWITSFVFSNNASFTCGLTCLSGFTAGDGVAFVGLGNMTMTGSGVTETGRNYCGFEIKKSAGVTTIIAIQCDGSGTVTFSGTLNTLTDGDTLELFIRMTSTGINYYTRLNGNAISSATTLTATMPSGSENNICFETSNKGSANDFQIQYQCAAYEH